jgi:hypothetical protein
MNTIIRPVWKSERSRRAFGKYRRTFLFGSSLHSTLPQPEFRPAALTKNTGDFDLPGVEDTPP